ncbi:hypothetical protein EDB80DRAFT_740511 [Ilyonectria destructans]|nr:hypothetical protein EDB80DRAFT_740511 [Ilyonectria destructans]
MPALTCTARGCGIVFRRREHLVRHERSHTKSRPFSCPQCGRAFSRSDVLKRHIGHHNKHSVPARAVSACDLCHRRKTRCDGQEQCVRCRDANLTCRRTRQPPTNAPFKNPLLQPLSDDIDALLQLPDLDTCSADLSMPAALISRSSPPSPHSPGRGQEDRGCNQNPPGHHQSPGVMPEQGFAYWEGHGSPACEDAVVGQGFGDSGTPGDPVSMESRSASYDRSSAESDAHIAAHAAGSTVFQAQGAGLEPLQPARLSLEDGAPQPGAASGAQREDDERFDSAGGLDLVATPQTDTGYQLRNHFPPAFGDASQASDEAANVDQHGDGGADVLACLGLGQTGDFNSVDMQSWEASVFTDLTHLSTHSEALSTHSEAPRDDREAGSSLPTTTGTGDFPRHRWTQMQSLPSTAENLFLESTFPAASPTQGLDALSPLPVELEKPSATLLHRRLVDRYFTSFHNHWPILHKPSFDQMQCAVELRYGVALIGSLLDGATELRASSIRLHKWLLQRLLSKATEVDTSRLSSQGHLQSLQAFLLNILFSWYIGELDLLSKACLVLPSLIMCIREAGYFRVEGVVAQDEKSASHTHRWLVREQKKRLALAVFRLDCYLNLLRDHPPSVRLPELCLNYPCSEAAWNAATPETWKLALAQEPVGRMDQTIGLTCIHALSEATRPSLTFLLPEDFEAGMCAMQSRLWEEAQHKHESTLCSVSPLSDTITSGIGYGLSWQVQLEIWRATMDHLSEQNRGHSAESTETWNRFTAMMQYHMSFLRMYADLKLIKRLIDSLGTDGYNPSLIRRFETQIQQWAKSTSAKQALWHAAQILELFNQNAPGIQALDSLVCPSTTACLFRAAQVVWAICRSTLSCDLCESSLAEHDNTWHSHKGSKGLYDLGHLQSDAEIGYWVTNRARASIGNIPFCACNMPALLDKYIAALQSWTLGWSTVRPMTDALMSLKNQQ